MSLTNKAVFVIERNSQRNLTLAEIAEACGVSRHHLAHAFGEATGLSVMQYLRGRRLTLAAQALASGAADILQLALDSGYASHEAFSRAFRAQFGKTPEDVRSDASTAGLALVEPLKLADRQSADLKPPRSEMAGAILVVGLSQRYSLGETQGIASQWQRFMPSCGDIEYRARDVPVGVCVNFDDDGAFDYHCALEVTKFGETPRGLTRLKIPPQRYAVFQHLAHISKLRATYSAIWNEALPAQHRVAADGPGLERHLETFCTRTGEGGVELWIPVAP